MAGISNALKLKRFFLSQKLSKFCKKKYLLFQKNNIKKCQNMSKIRQKIVKNLSKLVQREKKDFFLKASYGKCHGQICQFQRVRRSKMSV
jgi:hypothetical protein